jgi:glycosyltransferase involved in cell wall biosynthesis
MADPDLNVLLVSGEFQIRGSCAYTLRLARRLPEHGFRVRVVCPNADMLDADCRRQLDIAAYPHLNSPLVRNVVLQWVQCDLSQNPPDLIHIQTRRMLTPGTQLARSLRRPFILSVHDYIGPSERLQIDWRWCHRVVAVSESVRRNFLGRTGLPADRVVTIPSGVDATDLTGVTPPLDPGHVPVVGTAGPLEAVKGLPFFLGAAQKVLTTGRDVEFLIAGAGPEEPHLRRMARELGISDKVTFVPQLADVADSLAAIDIFCLPSLQQGLGTIMLEAMALGRPVIASRVGGVYSIVADNETGLLVPPSDSGQLADRMLELLCNPSRARALGESARQMVLRDCSLEAMLDRTAQLYRDVVAESRKCEKAPALS